MFKVYWTGSEGDANAKNFLELSEALLFSKWMRTCNATFVTMVSENPDSVGKPGVDSIVDGKTPDGHVYDWKKRRI